MHATVKLMSQQEFLVRKMTMTRRDVQYLNYNFEFWIIDLIDIYARMCLFLVCA